MSNPDNKIIITDTSVLINFLNIDRIDLLAAYPGSFFITEHVIEEISNDYSYQKIRLSKAIDDKILTVISVDSDDELVIYGELTKDDRLGVGECSAIACAISRRYILAIDDVRARKQAKQKDDGLVFLNTQDILISLIRDNVLSINAADLIKNQWEIEFRFALKIKSFIEVVT